MTNSNCSSVRTGIRRIIDSGSGSYAFSDRVLGAFANGIVAIADSTACPTFTGSGLAGRIMFTGPRSRLAGGKATCIIGNTSNTRCSVAMSTSKGALRTAGGTMAGTIIILTKAIVRCRRGSFTGSVLGGTSRGLLKRSRAFATGLRVGTTGYSCMSCTLNGGMFCTGCLHPMSMSPSSMSRLVSTAGNTSVTNLALGLVS